MGNKGHSSRGFFGNINHYDENGKKTGHSSPGFFGGYNHYDNGGKKTGHSSPGMFGGYKHAMLLYADEKGRLKLDDVVGYFKLYYEGRRSSGMLVEKKNSIFAKGGYTDSEAARNILANPFKRFEDMQMMRHTKTLGIIQVDEAVWKHLTAEEKAEIDSICDEKLKLYFERLTR